MLLMAFRRFLSKSMFISMARSIDDRSITLCCSRYGHQRTYPGPEVNRSVTAIRSNCRRTVQRKLAIMTD